MNAIPKPKIGISSCLLGTEVRYDGGHKHNGYVTSTLGKHFDFNAYCPEVGIGLSIPRPPIHLERRETGRIHAVEIKDADNDFTDRLEIFAANAADDFNNLCGLIVKKDSPSCGMERVKIYKPPNDSPPERKGTGIFTATLMSLHPSLPVEEEGRLMDPVLRENFITRVFARHRWLSLKADGISPQRLVAFHSAHKFLLMAHNETGYRELGRLIANAGKTDLEKLATDYEHLFMNTLAHRATPKQHANVLMHIMGFIKDKLSGEDKEELLGLIDDHRQGQVPLVVPITLLNHFLRRHPHEYIEKQLYLEPHPRELMLRNTI